MERNKKNCNKQHITCSSPHTKDSKYIAVLLPRLLGQLTLAKLCQNYYKRRPSYPSTRVDNNFGVLLL